MLWAAGQTNNNHITKAEINSKKGEKLLKYFRMIQGNIKP